MNECDSNAKTVGAQSSATGRSHWRIIVLITHLGDIGYNSFYTQFNSYVVLVENYAAGVWGYEDHQAPRTK